MARTTSKIVVLALLMAALVSSTFAQAQQTFKVGVVNPAEVLEKSVEGKNVIARLQENDKANQTKLTNLDDAIRQLETKFNTQRLTLTQEALMQLSSDLEKKRTERKRFAEDSYREWNDLQNRLFARVQNELIPIIEQLGKEMNLEVIFDLTKSGIIYANPTIDMTAEVIKRYDASKAPKK